ncbi:organic solvent tolerance protein [Rhodanobacter sp. FW510-R12]|uniref:LPS-assembly protein LptD n=1 Tax=unclassified Rhodanobacter TaxID=2621553 RepID=UPI0007A9E87D|nr:MULTISPECIES: LPS assembly protein LptD [unclassified Rhodanobacter]KZC17259.1 organic solvent tolerance protein [Rhodanobacter sp. FW104-R8]KZC29115.1 organic solvent tolerance protein [Rhodanobacter sp. FW510-T8]KZC33053.1 organic solvent tolerance protein [Rhodanobacter sp. FW510-R10]
MPKLPPRRLLAVAAALALIGGQADAHPARTPAANGTDQAADQACPLGSFHCARRPLNYAMCRPNALLEFYDPALSTDSSLRETSPTQVQAQHVDSSDQSVYHLSGEVRLQRADQLLQADRVDYNDTSTDYDARGNVRYQEASQLLAASHLRGNTDASRGIADDVRYQLLEARGNGSAKQGHMLDALHTRYTMATYSTCDVGHHLWEFRAKSITINKDTGVGVARNATMRLGNVPFLYLPYFSFPVDDRRKSGFLYPTIGHSSRSGYEISTPYYLNLAPNYDATLDPRYYSDRGAMLAGEFRYLLPGTNGQLNVEYVPRDHGKNDGLANTQGDSRYLVRFSDRTQLWSGWQFVGSYNHASDSSYLYDFGNNLSHTAVYMLDSGAAIMGGGKWWSASFGGTIYQNLNPFVTDSVLPYKQLPYARFSMDVPLSRWLEVGMDSSAAAFRKNGFIGGQREDLYPYLAASFGTSAWFVRPRLAYRYTAYQLDGDYRDYGFGGRLGGGATSPFDQKSPSRALPIVSLDSGLVFDRSTTLFGSSYTQTLEPRLYYLYVPYRNQNNLPLFDTNVMSFDYWQLFSTNQFSGADRQMDANNLTAALSTRLLDDGGVERVSASIGQIHYFSPQKVLGTDWVHSAYVAQLDVQLNDRWRLNTAYQWNPNTRLTDMAAVELQRRVRTDGIFNFSYRYRRGLLEQYSASLVYPVSERWRLVGAWTYSVKDHESVDALAGVEYDSCCVSLRLVGRSYVNQYYYGFGPAPTGNNLNHRDNAVMFEVVFKGLGSTGGQIDPLLRRDILGYQ